MTMNNGENPTGASSKPFASEGNSGKNKLKSANSLSELAPQRGKGVVNYEELREFDMDGQVADYETVHVIFQPSPSYYPFGSPHYPSPWMNTKGPWGMTETGDTHAVNPQRSMNYAVDGNSSQLARNAHQTQNTITKPADRNHTTTHEIEFMGKMQSGKGDTSQAEEIDLELRL